MNVWLQVLLGLGAGLMPAAFVMGLCYMAKWLNDRDQRRMNAEADALRAAEASAQT